MPDYQYIPPFTCPDTVAIAHRRGILGAGEDMAGGIARVSAALAATSSDASLREELHSALLAGHLGLSSQLFTASGRTGQVAACTVLSVPPTSDAGRLRSLIASAARASIAGLGCGIDLTSFDDPAGVARQMNTALSGLSRRMIAQGTRPPAFMLTCEAGHERVIEFIHLKDNADFGGWVANLSVRFDGDPATWWRLRDEVAAGAHRTGEPGVLFGAPALADNPTPQYQLESTAPCAEVFMAPGERCVFVSVNLAAHVRGGRLDWDAFASSTALAMRTADAAVDHAAVGAAPVVADRRRVGVGICGFHTALIAMGIPYAAAEGFARALAERLVFFAHSESARLSAEKGPFPAWGTSRWRDPAWLRRKAPRRCGAIAAPDWRALEQRMLSTGVRNAVCVAFPPTGIVSELLSVSKSYEPHFELRDRRGGMRPELDGKIPASQLAPDGQVPGAAEHHLLACARQLSPRVHLAVHAAFSELADEAGSKTVNLPGGSSISDVAELFEEARVRGLKGLTVFRDGCLEQRMAA